jgi:hypothetical protein
MAVSTTDVVLLSLITIDVNFTVNVKNWTRWGCFPGLASPFHFVKIQSTHTSLEPQEQSYNSCIKSKTPTLINGMQGSHTALLIHIIIVIDCSVAIWKVTMLQFTTSMYSDILQHISTSMLHRTRVWIYQRVYQSPYIEEEQTTQWPKEQVQKDKQRSTKHT